MYQQTLKHLQNGVVTKPDPEPVSDIDTCDITNKNQTYRQASQKPYMLHALAATPPKLVAHRCIKLSAQSSTPAKPAVAANTQCNQSAVQSSTEPKVLAPPSVPAAKVPASCASHI